MFEQVIRRGTLTAVVALIICVLGIFAGLRIPVQMIPDLDVRVITVITSWPGANPQDIEKEILIEQEEYLRTLPSVSRILATAESGRARIALEFPFGTDTTEMLIRVNNALSQVPSYPDNVDEPRVFATSFSSNYFMFFSVTPLAGNPRQLDLDLTVDFLEDNVRPRLSRIPGISEVAVWGGAERQVQILVDPSRLAQRGLSLSDVRTAIRSRNQDRSAGELDSGKRQYLLRTIGRFNSIEELNDLVLVRRGDSVIRLSDVATVRLDHFEKRSHATFDGEPTIGMALRRESGSNVIDIKRAITTEVDALNRELLEPAGLKLRVTSDDVSYVENSIRNVWQNLFLGALLATAVMFLFLRSARTTGIGVLGIPVCIIVALLGLLITGRTINVISLAGIAFAIGMTLDNSIVVLENIELEWRKGKTRFEAALDGVRQVWPAVFASTMTTVLVFVPVIFVEQEAGQLYSDVAIAVSAAILASMLVAITLLPAASSRFTPIARKPGVIDDLGRRCRDATLGAVDAMLSTQRRRIACLAITVMTSVAIVSLLTPAAEYLPEGEEPKVFATMSAPPGYNLNAMRAIGDELEEYFLNFVQADPDKYHRGEHEVPAMAYLNFRVNTDSVRIVTEPRDPADIESLMDAITKKYNEYPGMRAFASRGSIISSNDGGTRSINLDIAGNDLTEIYTLAGLAYERAGEVFDNPRIKSQPSSFTLAQPMVEVYPDWKRAAELGLTAQELGFTIAALTDGSFVDEFFLGDDKIDMYLYSTAGQTADLDTLGQLPIYTPSGAVLPLGSLASIEETIGTDSLRRVNGRRTVTLNIIPPRSVALETGVQQVREELVEYLRDRGDIPLGTEIAISGAADQLDATRASLLGNYAIALLVVYLLLVAIFSHWGYPLLIMTTIPLGIAGGVVGLALLNGVGAMLPLFGFSAITQPFDMISMLGFLILMGAVVNNPILIVDRAVKNLREKRLGPRDAVSEAVHARLRPIAMTTVTTILGLAPLVLIPGAGTELYRGVGAIVMFGILGSALVTITALPALTVTILELNDT